MTDVPLLWTSGARKEVMELLRRLWIQGSQATREALSAALVGGPPQHLLDRLPGDSRASSRDRRIYDRLVALERVGDPPLTDVLQAEARRLRQAYPEWRAPDGDQADFSTWMEFRVGPDSPVSAEELASYEVDQLTAVLHDTADRRDGLLDLWRDLAAAEPAKALDVLAALPPEPRLADAWTSALWGLRDHARTPELRLRALELLRELPEPMLADAELSRAAADILESAAKLRPLPDPDALFWTVFDRVLEMASRDPANAEAPQGDGWVGLAINRSMGSLASAFLDAMFARSLKVGAGVPNDLRERALRLLSPRLDAHRPARVILASRLSYLYAVDPAWTGAHLIPLFDWQNEEEALAAWQGFGWQPRIDPRLWATLKTHFLPMFTPERLERIGASGRTMAQLLMLVGVEFGMDELPRDAVRDAIRAMPERLRSDAAAWLATYLRQLADHEGDEGRDLSPDEAWTQRASPWLTRVWPREPDPDGRGVSSQFARAITALDQTFPQALETVSPFLMRGSADLALHELRDSVHPDHHPQAAVTLLDRIVDIDRIWMADDLRNILDRAARAAPELRASREFRRLDERLRVDDR